MVTMMDWHDGGWAWWQAGGMWLAMIVVLALLVWAGYALISGLARGTHGPDGSERQSGDARRILDERLAHGDIDAEEYRRLREVLDGGTGRSPAGTAGPR
jgi:putative membrane protein